MKTIYTNGTFIGSFSQADGTIRKTENGFALINEDKIIATRGFLIEGIPKLEPVSKSWSIAKFLQSFEVPETLEVEVEEIRQNIETHDHDRHYDNNVLLGHKLKVKNNEVLFRM